MAFKMFDKPIVKPASEMKAGDVIRVEYGEYGNFCNLVFESCRSYGEHNNRTETTYHGIYNETSDKFYEFKPIDEVMYEVIGKELAENVIPIKAVKIA